LLSRKIISLIIASAIILNSSGVIVFYFISLKLHKNYIKELLIEGLDDSLITIITIGKADMEKPGCFRREGKREFWWQGKLYDIVKEKESGGTTLFHCINDEKEEKLLKRYSASISIFIDLNGNSNFKKLYRFIFNDFASIKLLNQVLILSFFNLINLNSYINSNYKSIIPSIPSPPPKAL